MYRLEGGASTPMGGSYLQIKRYSRTGCGGPSTPMGGSYLQIKRYSHTGCGGAIHSNGGQLPPDQALLTYRLWGGHPLQWGAATSGSSTPLGLLLKLYTNINSYTKVYSCIHFVIVHVACDMHVKCNALLALET